MDPLEQLKKTSALNSLETKIFPQFPSYEKMPYYKSPTIYSSKPILSTPIYQNPQINSAMKKISKTPEMHPYYHSEARGDSFQEKLRREIEDIQMQLMSLDNIRSQKTQQIMQENLKNSYLSEYEKKLVQELRDQKSKKDKYGIFPYQKQSLQSLYNDHVSSPVSHNPFIDRSKKEKFLSEFSNQVYSEKPSSKASSRSFASALPELHVKYENIKRKLQEDCLEREIYTNQKKSFNNLVSVSGKSKEDLEEALKRRTFAKFDFERKKKLHNLISIN